MFEKNRKYWPVWIVALQLFGTIKLSAQKIVTLSDGQFTYRLSIEKIPQAQPSRYMQEPMEKPGEKQRPRIGFAFGTVKSITIFHVNDTNKRQIITPGKNESFWPWTEDNKGEKFIIEDMNFDGNNDIRLLKDPDDFTYYCWIYQPATGQFIEDTVLDGYRNPQFDQNQKLVYQNWERIKDGGKGTDIYKYIDGVITLIEEDETSNDQTNKITTTTIKKLVNGQMQTVSKTETPIN